MPKWVLLVIHCCYYYECLAFLKRPLLKGGRVNYPLQMTWVGLDPSAFCQGEIQWKGQRVAKDDDYLQAVMKPWRGESREFDVETKSFSYQGEAGTTLYGHLFRRKTPASTDDNHDSSSHGGVLLFHTGAGPHDVSLFAKADGILQKKNCVVLLCDILSDETGWAWDSNRERYNQVRTSLQADDGHLLRVRAVQAAHALCGEAEVNIRSLAVMGWCLGAQPVLELALVEETSDDPVFQVLLFITFHGVFHERKVTAASKESSSSTSATNVHISRKWAIFNGKDDPFVSTQGLAATVALLKTNNFEVDVVQYPGAKHGFSNPAQDFNPNPSFEYNHNAATQSWKKALELLGNSLP